MSSLSPRSMLIIGFLMVVIGAVLPFLIILDILPSTYFLNFLVFILSLGGVLMGMVAVAFYAVERDKEDQW